MNLVHDPTGLSVTMCCNLPGKQLARETMLTPLPHRSPDGQNTEQKSGNFCVVPSAYHKQRQMCTLWPPCCVYRAPPEHDRLQFMGGIIKKLYLIQYWSALTTTALSIDVSGGGKWNRRQLPTIYSTNDEKLIIWSLVQVDCCWLMSSRRQMGAN